MPVRLRQIYNALKITYHVWKRKLLLILRKCSIFISLTNNIKSALFIFYLFFLNHQLDIIKELQIVMNKFCKILFFSLKLIQGSVTLFRKSVCILWKIRRENCVLFLWRRISCFLAIIFVCLLQINKNRYLSSLQLLC